MPVSLLVFDFGLCHGHDDQDKQGRTTGGEQEDPEEKPIHHVSN